jgi:hypothetical protein
MSLWLEAGEVLKALPFILQHRKASLAVDNFYICVKAAAGINTHCLFSLIRLFSKKESQ